MDRFGTDPNAIAETETTARQSCSLLEKVQIGSGLLGPVAGNAAPDREDAGSGLRTDQAGVGIEIQIGVESSPGFAVLFPRYLIA